MLHSSAGWAAAVSRLAAGGPQSLQLILDRARIAAAKQQIYLATFVPPLLPTYSEYPAPFYAVFAALFCFTVLWSSVSLVTAAINDNRL